MSAGSPPSPSPAKARDRLCTRPSAAALVDNGTNVSVNGVVVNYRSPELNRLYWDLNGSTAGAGGSVLTGTWDSSTANWNPSSAGTSTPSAWNGGEVAMFAAGTDGGGTYTVTVSGTQSIGGLYFQTGNVTLQGGSFSLASDSTVTAASGVQTINTPISGSFALLKDGPEPSSLALSIRTPASPPSKMAFFNWEMPLPSKIQMSMWTLTTASISIRWPPLLGVSAAAAMSTSEVRLSTSAMTMSPPYIAGQLSGVRRSR